MLGTKTLDYGMFKSIDGNRPINKAHVQSLIEAMERRDLQEFYPILVNEFYEIIDGQHRLRARIQMGLPVYYEVVSGLRIEDVMQLNISSKSWTISDFIDSWVTLDKPDYKILKEYIAEYHLNATTSASILYGSFISTTNHGRMSEIVRNGKFHVRSEQSARIVGQWVNELKKYCDFDPTKDREFISSLCRLYQNKAFDFDRLIGKLKISNKLERRVSEKYYIILIEEVYNFKTLKTKTELYKSSYEGRR